MIDFVTGESARRDRAEQDRLERLERLTGVKQRPSKIDSAFPGFATSEAFQNAQRKFTGVERKVPQQPVFFEILENLKGVIHNDHFDQ